MVTASLATATSIGLAACTSPSTQAEQEAKSTDGKMRTADLEINLGAKTGNVLKKPSSKIKSLEEFVYVMDYLAFYKISDKLTFEIDEEYAKSFYNPYKEFQKAYSMADLADAYACNMDDTEYSKDRTITIKYSISDDIASKAPESIPTTPVLSSFDQVTSGGKAYELPIDKGDKKEVSCENSEQLFYLVMNGYRPKPVEGSVAEKLYKEARAVIESRINETDTDFQKIKKIYDYLTAEVRYDYDTAYSVDTYLVKEQAYYLEGVFFNHYAVCDGKSKAYALMLNMMGIDSYRTTGIGDNGDHAWNMVKLDGKWYTSCTTFGQANASKSLGRLLTNYATLLTNKETPYKDGWAFTPQKHLDIYEKLSEEPYDVYGQMSEDDNLKLVVTSIGEATESLDTIQSKMTSEYKVEINYMGDEPEKFQEDLVTYLKGKENANAMEIKSERGKVYEVVYLK